ncbi:MAG: FMN-binding protein [Acidobacteria bacterium]|nr:FMN-binding protein [Acidobacteriota bacterium]MDW7983300.1 FMN-binding protein [Acidobacteriota bacterium]
MTTQRRWVGLWLCISLGTPCLVRAQAPDRVEEILRRVFPLAAKVEKRFVYLTRDQQAEVEKRARVRSVPRLYRFYEVWQGSAVIGYGVTDTHVLRTHHETLLIVLDGDGRVRQVEVLAFEEPPDYQPSDRWLQRFQGRTLDDRLWLGRDVPNITGATITATAVLRSVRTVLAVWQVVYGGV